MTVKKRLVISNILMILVPVVITAFIGLVCISIIWFSVQYGTGLGFKDSEDFYKASRGISMLVEKSLEEGTHANLAGNLSGISGILDKSAMALSVDSSGKNLYQYGHATDADEALLKAVDTLGGQGFVSNGNRELYVQQAEIKGVVYRISIFSSPSQLSFGSLKVALVLSAIVLMFAIIFSILLTNRFLTRFVFQKIEQPLEILSDGVQQNSMPLLPPCRTSRPNASILTG